MWNLASCIMDTALYYYYMPVLQITVQHLSNVVHINNWSSFFFIKMKHDIWLEIILICKTDVLW